MLIAGLTGGLGSGKSTAASLFAALGAHVLSADEIARSLMQPGERVYTSIVGQFGPEIVLADGSLDRAALSRLAFGDGRIEELNAIVHPATIEQQAKLANTIFADDAQAVVIVESALIFETRHGATATENGDEATWRRRFDRLILVTAPEELRITRFVARSTLGRVISDGERLALEAEAYRRIARQIPDDQKVPLCDYVLTNNGAITELEWQVDHLWPLLVEAGKSIAK